jgi:hypothetical protein
MEWVAEVFFFAEVVFADVVFGAVVWADPTTGTARRAPRTIAAVFM